MMVERSCAVDGEIPVYDTIIFRVQLSNLQDEATNNQPGFFSASDCSSILCRLVQL